tara:strand:- start:120 stop:452 length:333 start_codon:yes stop_codon:yes gene_type:complete
MPEDEQEQDVNSTLTFYTQKDGSIYLDVSLSDYTDEIIDNFADMVSSIFCESFQLQAIEIVKEGLQQEGKAEELKRFIIKIAENTIVEKITSMNLQKSEDDPCIKPSEML